MSELGASANTTIEVGTQLKGSLESKCPVLVRGVVRGELSAPSLRVTEGGEVVGRVNTEELRSAGTLEGHMTAREMYVSGTVRDNSVIETRSLEVNPARSTEPTFVVFGDCVLNVGDEPALRPSAPAERPAVEAVATSAPASETAPSVPVASAPIASAEV